MSGILSRRHKAMKKSVSLLVGFLFLSIFVTSTRAVTRIAPTEAGHGLEALWR